MTFRMLARRTISQRLATLATGASMALAIATLPSLAQQAPAQLQTPQEAPAAQSQAAPSSPQQSGKLKSQHDAWSVLCDTPAGAKTEQCALIQNVVAAKRPELGLSVVVLKTADNKARILRVLAPLGVLLPNGLGLNVDGKDIGRAYFVRCFEDGCYAEVILEDDLLKTLRSGKAATFIVFQTPEEGVGIPVDLKGFGEGFDALP
ncbi:invasion associated locus B family protein [Brucella intermedia]|uniref:invasion associated locus B family protein n=1 Tax=Brucella intermedia TaxID=94625 RepID=UPI00124E6BF6|nr:invasion associated locus B family protein [Brucella intermedia]KAB2722284.1 invasion associated locus B family protein [Brucella intermedia]